MNTELFRFVTVGSENPQNTSFYLRPQRRAYLLILLSFLAMQKVVGGIGMPVNTLIANTNESISSAPAAKIVRTGIDLPTCLITLTANVSGCYDSNGNTTGGTNVASVQVVVNWTNNPVGETINVTCTGATAQSINPVTSPNRAVLTFVVPANAGAVTVTAAFSTTSSCSASQTVTAPAGNCLLEPCVAGNTGGKVWLDFNSNGIKDVGETQGLGGVIVKAYNGVGTLVETDTTDYLGQYTFTSFTPTSIDKYRLEFTNIPPQYKPTFNGTDGRTDVQFVSGADCSVDFGVNSPADYCQANPPLVTPCYVNGSTSNTTAPTDVLVKWSYNNSGLISGDETPIASKSQIGATWGVAYRKSTKRIYAAAFLKRHVGLLDNNGDGKGDLGAIYETNPSTSTSVLWLNLETLGINCGTIGTNAARGLGLPNAASNDAAAFDNIGKMGLGDLEISDDESTLYVTNLFDKKLYAIDIASKTISGSWVIPDPGCGTFTSGTLRINAGSETNYTDANDITWNADVQYIFSMKVSNTNTITNTYTGGTSGQNLYQTYNEPLLTTINYQIPLTNGSYTIKLHFSEPTFTAANLRKFNVAIEGTTVLTNFDIFATTGGTNIATVRTFTTTVSDGILNLLLSNGTAGNAIISGIEIVSNVGPGATVSAGSSRPFATKYYRGKVYVGVICDAQQSLNEGQMSANVYEFNGSTFTNVLTFPLNYTKAPVYSNDGVARGWHPWTSLIVGIKDGGAYAYQQPILSDIEFDINGDMVLGFMDRYGHQMGNYNYPLTGSSPLITAESAGDILRAAKFGNVFIIENSGKAGTITGANPTNQQGPGGGEFYNDNVRGDTVNKLLVV